MIVRPRSVLPLTLALGTLSVWSAFAEPPAAERAAPAASSEPKGAASAPPSMSLYHDALMRRAGPSAPFSANDVKERLRYAESLLQEGRVDDAAARLSELVSDPRFVPFAGDEDGKAASYLLGDAWARAGVYDAARAELRRVLENPRAWQGTATYARRAARRLVDVALERQAYAEGAEDLSRVPDAAPEEVRAEKAYVGGRAREARGDAEGAFALYGTVPTTSRFWSQATYLRGLIALERGRTKEAEDLFCKVADPKRQGQSTPVFADDKFFQVRDLARLALGRLAHENKRFDDARYYYYLVPSDSDRLAEALYESATTWYEKKDYEGARELLDELNALGTTHRYRDEALILDAYIDLALCRFEAADKKLVLFLQKYEPVRDVTRRLAAGAEPHAALRALREGGSPDDATTTIAAWLRRDPAFAASERREAVAMHHASSLRWTQKATLDLERGSQAAGAHQETPAAGENEERVRGELAAADRELLALEGVAPGQAKELRERWQKIHASLPEGPSRDGPSRAPRARTTADLGALLHDDAERAADLVTQVAALSTNLRAQSNEAAADALRRLDLRLSRLLRRARLGRIESVLGRKRALEVEIQAIADGYLPRSAVDALAPERFLEDNEEYWPFEGDDWPDEFVGGEGLR